LPSDEFFRLAKKMSLKEKKPEIFNNQWEEWMNSFGPSGKDQNRFVRNCFKGILANLVTPIWSFCCY